MDNMIDPNSAIRRFERQTGLCVPKPEQIQVERMIGEPKIFSGDPQALVEALKAKYGISLDPEKLKAWAEKVADLEINMKLDNPKPSLPEWKNTIKVIKK